MAKKRPKAIKIEGVKGSPTDMREIKLADTEREKQWSTNRHPLAKSGWRIIRK